MPAAASYSERDRALALLTVAEARVNRAGRCVLDSGSRDDVLLLVTQARAELRAAEAALEGDDGPEELEDEQALLRKAGLDHRGAP